MSGEGGLGLQVGVDSHDSDLINDFTIGWQHLNPLSQPNATLVLKQGKQVPVVKI